MPVFYVSVGRTRKYRTTLLTGNRRHWLDYKSLTGNSQKLLMITKIVLVGKDEKDDGVEDYLKKYVTGFGNLG